VEKEFLMGRWLSDCWSCVELRAVSQGREGIGSQEKGIYGRDRAAESMAAQDPHARHSGWFSIQAGLPFRLLRAQSRVITQPIECLT
jgi:hypothetical protein